ASGSVRSVSGLRSSSVSCRRSRLTVFCLLLGSPMSGDQKKPPYRCAAWAATPDQPGKLRPAQLALRRSSLLPYPTTSISLVKPFEARRLSGALTRARRGAISGQTKYRFATLHSFARLLLSAYGIGCVRGLEHGCAA